MPKVEKVSARMQHGTTGHTRRSRHAAHHICPSESVALGSKRVQVGRSNLRIAQRTDGARSLVIRKEKEHIGARGWRLTGLAAPSQRQKTAHSKTADIRSGSNTLVGFHRTALASDYSHSCGSRPHVGGLCRRTVQECEPAEHDAKFARMVNKTIVATVARPVLFTIGDFHRLTIKRTR